MRELLETAEELGAEIAGAPQVKRFMRAFERGGDLADRLAEVMGQFSFLRISPLLVAVRLQYLPAVEGLTQSESDREWFEEATKVGVTFQIIVEFLRSRLTGYPVLRVPHRRKGSPYLLDTNPLFVHHFPWERELSRTAIQLKEGSDLDGVFGSPTGIGTLLTQLARQSRARPSWQRFIRAAAALGAADKERLSTLDKVFREKTREEVVEEQAGDRMMACHAYRSAVLEETVAGSEGRVLEYLRSFEEVDELITLLAATIEVVIMKSQLEIQQMERLDLGQGLESLPFQGLTQLTEGFLEPGEPLLITARGGIEGMGYPTTLTMSFDGEARLEGRFFAFTD